MMGGLLVRTLNFPDNAFCANSERMAVAKGPTMDRRNKPKENNHV